MQHVVAFNIPNPLGVLGNVFNPFEWLNGAIQGLAKTEVGFFEQAIISPPPQPPHTWVAYLYGNSVGVAPLLSVGLTIILICVAVVKRSATSKAALSFLMACLIGAISLVWFRLMDFLIGLGTSLAKWAEFYHPHGNPAIITLPQSPNPLGSIIGLGAIFGVGGLVVLAFFAYSIVIVAVTFFGLPALVIWPLGERARGFLNWIVTLALVSMVFGRPVAILILEIGKFLGDALAGGNFFFQTFILVSSFVLALIAQIILVIMLHTQVNKVTGAIKSQVTGTVDINTPRGVRPDYSFASASRRTNSGIHREGGTAVKDATVGLALIGAAQVATNIGLPGSGIVIPAVHSMARRRGINREVTAREPRDVRRARRHPTPPPPDEDVWPE